MVITILLSLALLMFIAYRGYPVIIFAPICALVAASTSGMALLPTYTELYMPNAANFIKNMFPIFLLGALFGKLMEITGAARSIAVWLITTLGEKHVVLAVVLTTAFLTYGGISVFVVTFTMYPLAAVLFKRLDIPKRFIPGILFFGFATFTYALPGLAQIQNVIPTRYLGTDMFAGATFGLIIAAMILTFGMGYLTWRVRHARTMGEGYGLNHINEPLEADTTHDMLHPFLAIAPMLAVVILNFLLTKAIKTWDPAMLAGFTGITLQGMSATWALIMALLAGNLLIIGIGWKRIHVGDSNIQSVLTAGALASLMAIFNTAAEVGYGNVISKLPGFRVVADALLKLDPFGSPLFPEAITINILAGITASASGGMVIAFEAMGTHFIDWANQTGISMDMLHRTATMAACGLDSLPHNGAILTSLAICGLNHKQSYWDIFVLTVFTPIIMLFTCLAFYSIFIW